MQEQYSTQDIKKKVGQRCKDPEESKDSRVASKTRQAGDLPSVKLFNTVTAVKQRKQMPDKRDERNSTDTRISPYKHVSRDEPEPSMRTRDTPRPGMQGACRRRIYFVKGRVHRRCAPSDCMTVGKVIPTNTGKCSLKRASGRLPGRESEVLRMIYHTRRKAAIHA